MGEDTEAMMAELRANGYDSDAELQAFLNQPPSMMRSRSPSPVDLMEAGINSASLCGAFLGMGAEDGTVKDTHDRQSNEDVGFEVPVELRLLVNRDESTHAPCRGGELSRDFSACEPGVLDHHPTETDLHCSLAKVKPSLDAQDWADAQHARVQMEVTEPLCIELPPGRGGDIEVWRWCACTRLHGDGGACSNVTARSSGLCQWY